MTDRHAAIAANDGASAPVSKLRVAANDNAAPHPDCRIISDNAQIIFQRPELYQRARDGEVVSDGVCVRTYADMATPDEQSQVCAAHIDAINWKVDHVEFDEYTDIFTGETFQWEDEETEHFGNDWFYRRVA